MDLSNLEAVLILGWGKVENVNREEKKWKARHCSRSSSPTYTREKTLLILICPNVSPPLKVRIHSDFGLEIKRRLAWLRLTKDLLWSLSEECEFDSPGIFLWEPWNKNNTSWWRLLWTSLSCWSWKKQMESVKMKDDSTHSACKPIRTAFKRNLCIWRSFKTFSWKVWKLLQNEISFLSPYIMALSLPSLFEIILLRLQPYHRLPQLICFGFQLLSLQACWSKVCNIGHSVIRNRWTSSVTLNSLRFGFFSLFCLKYKIHHHKSYHLCALEIEITFEINWFYPQAETNFLLFLQLGFCLCHLLVPTCVHRGHLGIRSIVVSI